MKRSRDDSVPEWGKNLPGGLLDRWPRDENGRYDKPVFLTSCSGLDMQDELLINLLDAFGVPALRLFPNDGQFGKLILGQSGSGADLYVPESLYEQASDLLESQPEWEEDLDHET